MSDCPDAKTLALLVQGDLPPKVRQSVLSHLTSCIECRSRVEQIDPEKLNVGSPFSDDTITFLSGSDKRDASPARIDFDSRSRVTIEGYEIREEIHHGGQGVVYRARQTEPHREVALKILRPRGGSSLSTQERFKKEVDFIANLSHPNIVTIYESGFKSGLHYYSMEYIRGEPLTEYVNRHQLGATETLKLFQTVCAAVEFAQQHGVVHRDLKPANILVKEDGAPVILDFGLAKSTASNILDAAALTQTGEFVGTLAYAAPEQLAGRSDQVDARTDVYALGVMLFESLTGRRPYPTLDALRLLLDPIGDGLAPRPSTIRPELGQDVDKVVRRAMARQKDQRYRSAGALGDDLGHVLEGEPIDAATSSVAGALARMLRSHARRHQVVALIAVLLFSIGIGNWLVHRIVSVWTPLDRVFIRTMTTWFTPGVEGGSYSNVIMVGMTDGCDLAAIADSEGLSDVSLDNPRSLRRLHGRLLSTLTQFRPRAVVCDIWFRGDSAYDADIGRGIAELADAGVPVVVASGKWSLAGAPLEVSSSVLGRAFTGCMAAELNDDHWAVELVAQRGANRTQPSLSLMAVALYRQPTLTPDFLLLEQSSSVAIRYVGDDHAAGSSTASPDHVPYSILRDVRQDDDEYGVRVGDNVGLLQVSVAEDRVLESSTLSYEKVFAADTEMLRGCIEGKLVILADMRYASAPGGKELADYSPYPDGRTLARGYAHAAAIEYMLQTLGQTRHSGERIRRNLGWTAGFVDTGVAAVCGLVLACLLYRDRKLLWIAMISVCVIFCVVSLTLAARYQVLMNPATGVVVLVIAGVLGAVVRRLSPA